MMRHSTFLISTLAVLMSASGALMAQEEDELSLEDLAQDAIYLDGDYVNPDGVSFSSSIDPGWPAFTAGSARARTSLNVGCQGINFDFQWDAMQANFQSQVERIVTDLPGMATVMYINSQPGLQAMVNNLNQVMNADLRMNSINCQAAARLANEAHDARLANMEQQAIVDCASRGDAEDCWSNIESGLASLTRIYGETFAWINENAQLDWTQAQSNRPNETRFSDFEASQDGVAASAAGDDFCEVYNGANGELTQMGYLYMTLDSWTCSEFRLMEGVLGGYHYDKNASSEDIHSDAFSTWYPRGKRPSPDWEDAVKTQADLNQVHNKLFQVIYADMYAVLRAGAEWRESEAYERLTSIPTFNGISRSQMQALFRLQDTQKPQLDSFIFVLAQRQALNYVHFMVGRLVTSMPQFKSVDYGMSVEHKERFMSQTEALERELQMLEERIELSVRERDIWTAVENASQ